MVTILREADEKPVPEVAKKHGVSAQTIYAWRKHFGSLEAMDVKRLRQLEQESSRLKKMVAERDREIDVLQEITRKKVVGARARRQQVAYAEGRGLSRRRACALLTVARSTLAMSRDSRRGTVPSSTRCVDWPASIRGTGIVAFGSSCSGKGTL